MGEIAFVVRGVPRGKQRPKFGRVGGFVKTYTPDQTIEYENLVKLEYQRQCEGAAMLQGAVEAKIYAFFPIPKSVSKKKKLEMLNGGKHTKKCDADNIAKIVLDSLNQIAFEDDAAVSDLIVRKRYSEEPRVEVYLCEAGDIFF